MLNYSFFVVRNAMSHAQLVSFKSHLRLLSYLSKNKYRMLNKRMQKTFVEKITFFIKEFSI